MSLDDICKIAVGIRDDYPKIDGIMLCDNGYRISPVYYTGEHLRDDNVYLIGFDGKVLATNYMDAEELAGNYLKEIEVPEKYRSDGYITLAEWQKMIDEENAT